MEPANKVKRKLCQAVGVNWHDIDFFDHADPYFWKHSWTKEQEQKFTDWLTDYLYSSKEARIEFMRNPMKNKKRCRKVAGEFTWNHGWRTR